MIELEGVTFMKEFRVSYFFEDHVRTESIVKSLNVTTEQMFEELIKKVTVNNFLMIRSKQGLDRLDTSLIRYIRVSTLKDK